MQEIYHDIVTEPDRFQVILLPISMYQKKNGSIPIPKEGLLSKLAEKYPDLPLEAGSGVEKFGNCPAILSHIKGTKYPTKFMTFPVSPTSIRAKNPNDYVFNRFKNRFKEYTLLPGWVLVPRSDVVEFSSIKLFEIMRYYKLDKVAIPFEMFTFDREDKNDYTRIKNIISSHVKDGIYIVTTPKEKQSGTIINTTVQSSVTYED